jgi:hypothetical protein
MTGIVQVKDFMARVSLDTLCRPRPFRTLRYVLSFFKQKAGLGLLPEEFGCLVNSGMQRPLRFCFLVLIYGLSEFVDLALTYLLFGVDLRLFT